MAAPKIAVSVLVVTKNPGAQLHECLSALEGFDEIIVVDSHSDDDTAAIAAAHSVRLICFTWNNHYPKKRQWVLDNVETRNEWILFVDADERMTAELKGEMAALLPGTSQSAFFVKGQPVFCHKLLGHGRWNNKIVLARKTRLRYPVQADADTAMGEIEGHYQPHVIGPVGQLRHPLIHVCADSIDMWLDRHRRYADWQLAVDTRGIDLGNGEHGWRRGIKRLFNNTSWRPVIAFMDCYILQRGFLDGRAGLHYALARAWYYWHVSAKACEAANKAADTGGEGRT